jgi:hypothetical protein
VHVPATHDSPVAHVFPHDPQLVTSVCRLRQTPEQSVVPEEHEILHSPETQFSVPAHVFPHEPQWRRSLARFAQ